MLTVIVPEMELYDEVNNEFRFIKSQTLVLEHSLLSLSKWESKWHKPFFSKTQKTHEETIDYIRCMTINSVDPEIFYHVPPNIIERINSYIEDPMTATTIKQQNNKPSREVITAEIIYYWMVALNIPFECQKWHLNRLLTLINVCSIKNKPAKKMSKKDIISRNASLNAARRKALHTTG